MRRGTIIWIELTDQHGANPKERPALVLSSDDQIAAGTPIVVAAISTQFSRPLLSHWIELPSHPQGDPITGLYQPSVVKSDWLKRVTQQEVIREAGRAPSRIVNRS